MLGMEIIVSPACVEVVENWPKKRRSRRLEKKLIKKLGPQSVLRPSVFLLQGKMIVHPEIYEKIKERLG